jgi:ATP-binding cassette subfamily B protein
VVDVLPDLELALAAAGRLFDLGSRSPALTVPAAADASPGDSSIWFRDVSVRRGASIVLSGVDVSIASGSFVAVVGPSGSGKSTLVESLVRFRDPDDGAVEVGGADLRDIPPSRLRSMVALVPQRPDLFFGTIADNLRLARPGASPDELIAALDRAALGDWVRTLPRGLDTSIGELGETMSGGQRQRLTIARVLLRDPEILVLDEATSELDSATEQRVLQTLHLERGARTLIVVAHRLETVTGADEILVLDRGRLVERGTHQDLVAAGGVYEGLWSRHEDALAET